jgi:exonuclease III
VRRAFAVVLLAFSLTARAQYVGAASPEAAADLSDTFRDLWNRFRGRPAPQAPAGDDAALGRLVSWNVQTLGKKASQAKQDALRLGLGRALRGAGTTVFAAQEIANDAGAEILARALPDGGRGWETSFEDTPDAQDNGLYFSRGVQVDCAATLSIEGVEHSPRMAHVKIGDADFTVLSVHLSYAKGDATASNAELALILGWIREKMAKPGADQDFVIAGDFNLPTRRGKALSARSGDRSWDPLEDTIGDGFEALVDEPTSRRGREAAANNYDHFIVSRHFADSLLVVAGAVDEAEVALAERETGVRASDHFPIAMTFRKAGAGRDGKPIATDGPSVCR